jgi:hypothetical protein
MNAGVFIMIGIDGEVRGHLIAPSEKEQRETESLLELLRPQLIRIREIVVEEIAQRAAGNREAA